MKKRCLLLVLTVTLILSSTSSFCYSHGSRVAIVITASGMKNLWEKTQMAAHGWAGVMHLAGVPYDTVFLDDVLNSNISEIAAKYDALILVQCESISDSQCDNLFTFLSSYLSQKGNLIIDGVLATQDESGKSRDAGKLFDLLGIEYLGYHNGYGYRIRAAQGRHPIVRGFQPGQFITQPLAEGLNIMRFKQNGDELLVASGPEAPFPFLSVRVQNGVRVIITNDAFTSAGVASFFRNVAPNVFYPNRIYDCLVSAVYWAVYGEIDSPFPAMQLSNSDLSAIVRLDADMSWSTDAQQTTMDYLVDLAKKTGVVSVYGWVSNEASGAGWETLSILGERLEKFGGQIGTHSRYHNLDVELTEEIAKEELDGSVEEIEANMNKFGRPIGKVEFFINPNNTIPMYYYETIAKRFSFYMTHGWEQQIPLAYGNMTWVSGTNRDFVVVNNSPSPDYQWFYDPGWSYTTFQITAYQEAIFDHMFQNVRRGVIFNQMWHDYSIVSAPIEYDNGFNPLDWFRNRKRRITNEDHRPMYDALADKFGSHPIYCPDPIDLGNKLRAMAQWKYSWEASENMVEVNLDLSDVHSASLADYIGGMGLRIENSTDKIQSVQINGREHRAFRDHVVILPNLEPGKNIIRVKLGPEFVHKTRLTFVSKRMPSIRVEEDRMETTLLTKSKAKFSFYVEKPFALLNADWQEWNYKGDRTLNGYVTSNRRLILKELEDSDFLIMRATVPISDISKLGDSISITVFEPEKNERMLWFKSRRKPRKVLLDGDMLDASEHRGIYKVALPEYYKIARLQVRF